ncbi:Pentatricopeptide repeat-containing protein At4g21300 [Linum perenne]
MHRIQFLHRPFSSSISGLFKGSISSTSSLHSLAVSNQWEWSDDSIANRLEDVLHLCPGPCNLGQGKQVHAQFIVHGLLDASLLGSKILAMYVLHDSFRDAVKMFYQVPLCYTMPWNWMIRGFNKLGRFDMALLFYFKMSACGVYPDKYTFPSIMKACCGLNNVALGKLIHDDVLEMGFDLDMYMGSSLVKLYAENGNLQDARLLFSRMSQKDCVMWNVMLSSFARYGESGSALKTFNEMRSSGIIPNAVTFACVLSVCNAEAMIGFGYVVHGLAVTYGLQFDPQVANTIVSMYSKCRQLVDARKMFDRMSQSDLVKWNGMMAGLVQHGFMEEASNLFNEMISTGIKPDSRTFATFLPSVTDSMSFSLGKEIHGYIIRHDICLDVFLKSALIDIYCKCRNVEMAHKIFSQGSNIDLVMCTAMISGYVLNGKDNNALEVFRWLLQENMTPNSLTMASVLPACAGLAAIKLGEELHGNILKNGLLKDSVHLESAVMDMYAKCGRLDLAHQIFRRMSVKDAISWNSIITSCTQNSSPEEAIDLFRQMGKEGLTYNRVSISAALSACSNMPALHYGKQIHNVLVKSAVDSDVFAESALIDMYAKCGYLEVARRVFDNMAVKNEVSWNSIIAAYANNGCLDETLTLFHQMLDNGFHPDHVTFLGIISACAHAGQVDDGIRYFHYMTEVCGIPKKMEHYACVIDMFGRAGRLNEAYEMIKSMPFQPDAGVWGTLLGACRVHGNVELGKEASRYLLDLDPKNSGYYVLLANMHADASQWKSVRNIRTLMKDRGVHKVPGYSWVDVNHTTHMFVAADGSHPESTKIYSLLESLLPELRKEGYSPQSYLSDASPCVRSVVVG